MEYLDTNAKLINLRLESGTFFLPLFGILPKEGSSHPDNALGARTSKALSCYKTFSLLSDKNSHCVQHGPTKRLSAPAPNSFLSRPLPTHCTTTTVIIIIIIVTVVFTKTQVCRLQLVKKFRKDISATSFLYLSERRIASLSRLSFLQLSSISRHFPFLNS
jgi:hypothetical protein